MSETFTGRRVPTFDDIERAGDYSGPHDLDVSDPDGAKRAIWFLLPIHEGATKFDRPTRGSGIHGVYEPPWSFRECDDGSVEIRASIACGRHDIDGTGEHLGEYWHGWLNEGHQWTWG